MQDTDKHGGENGSFAHPCHHPQGVGNQCGNPPDTGPGIACSHGHEHMGNPGRFGFVRRMGEQCSHFIQSRCPSCFSKTKSSRSGQHNNIVAMFHGGHEPLVIRLGDLC